MPGNYLIAEDYGRLLREFAAGFSTNCEPARVKAMDADYDPLRLRPVAEVASSIEKLLGVATEVPIAWRLGEFWAANGSDLLGTNPYWQQVTNTRTITHRSSSEGGLAAIHSGESAHDPIMRFLFHSIVAAKLTHVFKFYGGSERQHQLDMRAHCFGSLMQGIDRKLDFVDIEFRESEVTLGISRDVLKYQLPDQDGRLRVALDRELRRKSADVPVTASWKDRIKYHIQSNHLADISLDEMCDTFRVQRRSLGRLLRNEGTTFTISLPLHPDSRGGENKS